MEAVLRWSTTFVALALCTCVGCGDDAAPSNDNNNNVPPGCGNSIVEPGEMCDDGVENSDADPDACRSNCVSAACGDGVADSAEECDHDDTKGMICSDIGFDSGNLACNIDCEFDESDCSNCGNGLLEAGEDCDGSNVGLSTCLAVTGKQEGTLGCDAECTFIADGCHTCGDGVLEGPEECEEGNVGTNTCLDAGYSWGDVTCDSDCRIDLGQCFAVCGNGRAEPGEECDGQDLNSLDCQLMAPEFTGGELQCSSSCLLNVADCSTCGNGNLDTITEECDGADLGGVTCATLSAGVMTGTLACTTGCRRDITGCTAQTTCGNGIVEVGEQCDGHTLNNQTCQSLFPGLYGGGALTCASNCLFDTTWCLPEERCGNGTIEPDFGEECDGANLGGYTCANLGYVGGQLACSTTCALDLSSCAAPVTCGNGVLDPMFNESCDGTELDGQTCANLGFHAGTLSCNGQCDFDTSACTTCGDGVLNGPDECDNTDFGGQTCQSLGYYGGQIGCTAACELDIADCQAAGQCGDSIANGAEDCDGIDLDNSSCNSLGYIGGILACRPDCVFDEWACTNCGNGARDIGEQCDQSDLGQTSCATLGYQGGTLSCTNHCTFNPVNCQGAGSCGNGVLDVGTEECDGVDVGILACTDLGYRGGQLACTAQCTLDISDCVLNGYCGEGVLQSPFEICDDQDFGTDTCANHGFDGGYLTCDVGCSSIDDALCTTCGNGILEPSGEQCDGLNLNGESCQSLASSGGVLACDSSCQFDLSGCTVCGDGVVESGEECDDGNTTSWDGCTTCLTSEFQVNVYWDGVQKRQDVSMAADGSFVVVWDTRDASNYWSIYARRYDSTGAPIGADFQADDTLQDSQKPRVAMAPDGSFLVAWHNSQSDLSGRFFDPNGIPHTGAQLLGDTSASRPYAIASTSDGSYIAVWQLGNTMLGAWYDNTGFQLTADFPLATSSLADSVSIGVQSTNNIVLVWGSIVFPDESEITACVFDRSGASITGEIDINTTTVFDQESPSVSIMGNDGFVVVWESELQDGSQDGIYGRIFNANGTALSAEIPINQTTAGAQQLPSVSATADGRFVVAWQDAPDRMGRLFHSSGVPLGGEFLLNTLTYPGSVGDSPVRVVRHSSTGKFVAAWDVIGHLDGYERAIFAQRFTPLGTPLGATPW